MPCRLCVHRKTNLYHTIMKQTVENQDRLDVKQLMIDKLLVSNGEVVGVEAETGKF